MKTSHQETERIEAILSELSLEEKVSLCHANSGFTVNAIPRLGIPELVMSDGPHGVRQELDRHSWAALQAEDDYVTYLPTGVCLAATWNTDMARAFGRVLGAEARARGKDIILGPGINIARTPLCGRNFEYYGEDPCHAAVMVVPAIQAIQDQGVAACVKHYALNNQELNRFGVDARPDERTLREIYLPGFEAAVKEGSVLTAMGAYNKYYGQHCCHNHSLVQAILKEEWGFDGCYISDWGGTHDTQEAALNGLDIEMGGGSDYDNYYLAHPFLELINKHEVPEAVLDDKVRRTLRVMLRCGLLDDGRKAGVVNTPEHQAAALHIAEEGIVLLKNEGVLPLDRGRLRKLAVIGENAVAKHGAAGGSSEVKAVYEVTPLEGLQTLLGDEVEITFVKGYPQAPDGLEPIPVDCLTPGEGSAGVRGWSASYYDNLRQHGEPTIERIDPAVDFDFAVSAPIDIEAVDGFSARWETILNVPETGNYTFVLSGMDFCQLRIDGKQCINLWGSEAPITLEHDLELKAGERHNLQVNYNMKRLPPVISLGWITPSAAKAGSQNTHSEAIAAAASADAVLFFGGHSHLDDTEGKDKDSIQLRFGQNALVEALAAANPNTVVTLTGGGPMEMPWAENVAAILQMWYAGMEGGNAIAKILFGEVNPSGKLPVTFPRRLQDIPAHALDDYHADICEYKEGIMVGYRHFDSDDIEPLFPFGHGLSYTNFELEDLQLNPAESGNLAARVHITNSGPCPGAEVVQLYVRDTECSVTRPVKELKGFSKVYLGPGESRDVSFPLSKRDLSYFAPGKGWIAEPGEFEILVGTSSRDIRCRATFTLDG